MGDGAQGIQYHAGVLQSDETLTPRAIQLFIEEVKNELTLGSENYFNPLPIQPSLEPNNYPEQFRFLEDETIFPEFHENIIRGQYQKIAANLNVRGSTPLLPICDPMAVAAALDLKAAAPKFPQGFIEFMTPNVPKLALTLNIMPPPKLCAKFPNLIKAPPGLPNLDIGQLPNPQLLDLNIDHLFGLKLPLVLTSLIAKAPELALKILAPPELFTFVFDAAIDAKLFQIPPGGNVKQAAYKVLTKKVGEMILFTTVGKTLGSSPIGIVGGLGRAAGYGPPEEDNEVVPQSIRDRILAYAEECVSPVELSWGNKNEISSGFTVQDSYVQHLLYTEWGSDAEGSPRNELPSKDPQKDSRIIGKAATIHKASRMSSCGVFVRACYAAAGATYVFLYNGQPLLNRNPKTKRYYDFFLDEYRILGNGGIAIAGLAQAAKTKGALIAPVKGDLPQLKKGDSIVIYDPYVSGREHMILVARDYEPKSFVLHTIEGGQVDDRNDNKPTAIRRKKYVLSTTDEFRKKKSVLDVPYAISFDANGYPLLDGRAINVFIDGEICCSSLLGSDATNPSDVLTATFVDSNNPQADADAGRLPKPG